MDWDKLRVFHAVAAAGSLTHAGEVLHLSQSAVSRQIRGLEEQVGSTLFHRHPRGLLLTEEGEVLYESTSEIAESLTRAEARIRDARDEVWGELRVTTSVGFGTMWLTPRLGHLFERYPDLSMDLILTEEIIDLPMRQADVAIRLREPNQADLIRRRLMDVQMGLYVSKGYVEKFGAPRTREDMRQHRVCAYSDRSPQPAEVATWLDAELKSMNRSLVTMNNYFGVLQAAEHGLGVAALPDYVVQGNSRLVKVADDVECPSFSVYLAYPEELRSARRVIAFRDFLVEEIAAFRKGA